MLHVIGREAVLFMNIHNIVFKKSSTCPYTNEGDITYTICIWQHDLNAANKNQTMTRKYYLN